MLYHLVLSKSIGRRLKEIKPINPPNTKNIINTKLENKIIDSVFDPILENKKIRVASLVPKPEILIGRKLTKLAIPIDRLTKIKSIDRFTDRLIK